MDESAPLLNRRYRLDGAPGVGGRLTALDEGTGNRVILHALPLAEDGEPRDRQRTWARQVAGLHHPLFPPIQDLFTDGGRLYLVSRALPGEPLLLTDSTFDAVTVSVIGDRLLEGLDYLHSQDVPLTHGAVSPERLLRSPGGELLLEWALESQSGSGPPSPYRALEQLRGGTVDPRSDLYGAAATLYHLLTGVDPADALSRAAAQVEGQPDPLRPPHEVDPAIPFDLSAWLMEGLGLGRAQRFHSARAMREALAAIEAAPPPVVPLGTAEEAPTETMLAVAADEGATRVHDAAPPASPPPPIEPSTPEPGGRGIPLLVPIAVVLLALLAVGAGGAWWLGAGPFERALPTLEPVVVVASETPLSNPDPTPEPPASATVRPTESDPEASPEPPAVATVSLSPTATIRRRDPPTPTPNPSPTRLFAPTPSPSVTPAPIGVNCTVEVGPSFAGVWSTLNEQLGCPTRTERVIPTIAEELFEGGKTFWRSDTDQVYVIYERDRVSGEVVFAGLWQTDPSWVWDGSFPDGIGLEPPPGRVEPVRGFGYVWRNFLDAQDGPLGWALDREYGFDNIGRSQRFENGLMFRGSDLVVYVLLDDGRFLRR